MRVAYKYSLAVRWFKPTISDLLKTNVYFIKEMITNYNQAINYDEPAMDIEPAFFELTLIFSSCHCATSSSSPQAAENNPYVVGLNFPFTPTFEISTQD